MLGERRPNFLFSDLELSLLRLKFAFNSSSFLKLIITFIWTDISFVCLNYSGFLTNYGLEM